jgi:hypothetical protein
VIVPAILTNTPQLREHIRQTLPMLVPDVVRINFDIGFDAMGFPSIFFNISCSPTTLAAPRGCVMPFSASPLRS